MARSSHTSSSFVTCLIDPFARFVATEASSGIVLMACAAIALAWANSPWAGSYDALWHHSLRIGVGSASFAMSTQHWINDGLMALFFFVVGLEIKHELIAGTLASVKHAALPIAAAIGGMLIPAACYVLMNIGHPGQNGWGIPMATDIAFALGVLALLGSRVPLGVKVFLTALAIVDDLGAMLVIAVFYTSTILWSALAIGLAAVGLSALGSKLGVRHPLFYLVAGLIAWAGMLHSGVHATIAGVLVALTIPTDQLTRVVRAMHGTVSFAIMPLFALANTGVALTAGSAVASDAPLRVAAGIALGLIVGKPLGITLFTWLAVRTGLAALPDHTSWRALHGAGWLGGIGFTMSLFVAALAFGNGALLAPAKLATLGASCIAGFIGWLILRPLRPPTTVAMQS